jgi:mono/diheme cytochrome c family protein
MLPTATRTGLARKLVAAASLVALTAATGVGLLGQATADPVSATPAVHTTATLSSATPDDRKRMLTQFCGGCHNDKSKTAGMSIMPLKADNIEAHTATWEKILRRVSLGEMPPRGMKRPSKEEIADFTNWLEGSLDKMGAANPDPGRATLRRLNRAEYANAVRDLLDLQIDVSADLPFDDSGYGFDNIADVLTVSRTLMDKYIRVGARVSRTATGLVSRSPVVTEHKLSKDPYVNERASDELPLGSRGGGAFKFYAPYDADYTVIVNLNPGLGADIQKNPADRIEARVALTAGQHVIGASFRKNMALETTLTPRTIVQLRMPKPATTPPPLTLDIQVDGVRTKTVAVPAHALGFQDAGIPHTDVIAARDVQAISVAGPYEIKGAGDTPSRRRIFSCRPGEGISESACARKILTGLARHAYRRPVTSADIAPLMTMYNEGRKGGTFEHGVEAGLEVILSSPNFLFLRETDPPRAKPGSVRRITDVELASRLSLFLWSSIPDEELLVAAEKGQLSKPEVLQQQVSRMLADPKAKALTANFAGQWLHLRRLEAQKPDKVVYPNFDQRLRTAMLTETEMFFESVIRDNRSALDFLDADYTFLNQRLAEHYGMGGIYGTTFRKVKLDPKLRRGGLLGQASILTVTSYNNRTSVVMRGKWILENILAAPPPPPPPDIPALNDAKNGKLLSVREQMEMHRANPVCASCHNKMDPLGFSLENYDAVGAWRTSFAGKPIDASAVLPDGTKFDGPTGLQNILMTRKEQFVEALTERLLTYGLGRGVEYYDMPAIREVRDRARRDDYRMNTIIMGIVQSVPFVMKRIPEK